MYHFVFEENVGGIVISISCAAGNCGSHENSAGWWTLIITINVIGKFSDLPLRCRSTEPFRVKIFIVFSHPLFLPFSVEIL